MLILSFTSIYLAKLEKKSEGKTKNDPTMVWPILLRQYTDDGFGIPKGSKTNLEYWISEFNKSVESIVIDKFKHGPKVEYMDLVIYKGNR